MVDAAADMLDDDVCGVVDIIDVIAFASDQCVLARTAIQPVVARTAFQPVVPVTSAQGVRAVAADHPVVARPVVEGGARAQQHVDRRGVARSVFEPDRQVG